MSSYPDIVTAAVSTIQIHRHLHDVVCEQPNDIGPDTLMLTCWMVTSRQDKEAERVMRELVHILIHSSIAQLAFKSTNLLEADAATIWPAHVARPFASMNQTNEGV